MTDYTVEVTTAPVDDGDFSVHYRVLDAVPGTLLMEDPVEPRLIFPVAEDSPFRAALFVDGVLSLVGVVPISGQAYPTPEADYADDLFDDDDDAAAVAGESSEARTAHKRVDALPDVRQYA